MPDTLTVLKLNPNGSRPAPFSFSRWTWIRCELPELIGEDGGCFAAEVLLNPTLGQVRKERIVHADYLTAKENDDPHLEEFEAAYLQEIAPRVRAWNAMANGPDGPIPIPAPGETNDPDAWKAFLTIPVLYLQWLTTVVRMLHMGIGDPKAKPGEPESSAPSGPTLGPSTVEPDPNSGEAAPE